MPRNFFCCGASHDISVWDNELTTSPRLQKWGGPARVEDTFSVYRIQKSLQYITSCIHSEKRESRRWMRTVYARRRDLSRWTKITMDRLSCDLPLWITFPQITVTIHLAFVYIPIFRILYEGSFWQQQRRRYNYNHEVVVVIIVTSHQKGSGTTSWPSKPPNRCIFSGGTIGFFRWCCCRRFFMVFLKTKIVDSYNNNKDDNNIMPIRIYCEW